MILGFLCEQFLSHEWGWYLHGLSRWVSVTTPGPWLHQAVWSRPWLVFLNLLKKLMGHWAGLYSFTMLQLLQQQNNKCTKAKNVILSFNQTHKPPVSSSFAPSSFPITSSLIWPQTKMRADGDWLFAQDLFIWIDKCWSIK